MSQTQTDQPATQPKTRTLIAAWLGSVAAWFIHLFASYSFVEWYCHHPQTWPGATAVWILNGLTLVALVVAVGSCYTAWRLRARYKNSASYSQSDAIARRRLFLLTSGVLMGMLMTLLICVAGSVNLMVPLCIQ